MSTNFCDPSRVVSAGLGLALSVLSLHAWGQNREMATDFPEPSADVVAVKPLPMAQWSPRLQDLGLGGVLRLRGTQSEASVGLGIRRDELVESARLRLQFTLSPSLLPELSHLKVSFNDQLIQTIVLPKERLGQPHQVELEIHPSYFGDYNRLQFQFIGHYTLDCEEPEHSSLWAEISGESRLHLSLRRLPLKTDLALLPAPFFDPRDNRKVQVPIVYGSSPGQGEFKAAGAIAGWMGALAAYRGSQFSILQNQLPQGSAIVIASNANRPVFFDALEIAEVQHPTLTMIEHPEIEGAKLLLVLGKDAAQVEAAAQALALSKAALSGRSVRVTEFQWPELRQAYDAPRWISSRRPVALGELVERPEELQLRGTALYDTIRVNARMAPDLFTWNARGVPLNLQYRYTPTPLSDRGTLNVALNQQFLKSYSLHASSDNRGTVSTLLPMVESAPGQSRSNMKIPAFMVGGDNQMQFTFSIPPADLGRCRSTQPVELRAALDPQSNIDVTGFHHYIAMPNLAAFANSGYPFTKYADLAQTAIVLPKQPSMADIQTYLMAVARMAASTGYAGTRFELLSTEQIHEAKDRDILLISHGDKDGVLRQWQADLPALLAAGKRSVQPLERGLNRFYEMFRVGEGAPTHPSTGITTLEGDGPLAAVVGLQSPYAKGRSVVALTATDPQAMHSLSLSLGDSAKIEQLHGDLSLLRADVVESFRINPVYYVGDLPWYQRWWFHLHSYPILLALLGIFAGLAVTLLIYGSLRAIARRRLERDDG